MISPHQHDEAVRLLGLDPATVHLLPDGVDVERFAVRRADDDGAARALARMARARSAGLGRGEPDAGERSLHRGRGRRGVLRREHRRAAPRPDVRRALPGFKRVPLLVRAYARARARMAVPAPLVIWGGAPGEWEGEHPHSVATRMGVERRLLRRLARPRRPTARPRLCRLLRRPVDGRAVRARLPRGDGLRAARDRHAQRRAAELRQRRARRAGRLARAARRRGALAEAIVQAVNDPPDAAGAGRTPPGTSATATPGTASRAASQSCTTTSRPPTSTDRWDQRSDRRAMVQAFRLAAPATTDGEAGLEPAASDRA